MEPVQEDPIWKRDKKLRFKVMALIFMLIQLPFLGAMMHPRVQEILGQAMALGFLVVESVAMLVVFGFLWIFLDRKNEQ